MKRNNYISKKYLVELKREKMLQIRMSNNFEIKRHLFNDIRLINKLLKVKEED